MGSEMCIRDSYHIFLRRVTIPIILILVFMMVYDLLSKFISDDMTLILSALITGLSVGPILGLERYFAESWQDK